MYAGSRRVSILGFGLCCNYGLRLVLGSFLGRYVNEGAWPFPRNLVFCRTAIYIINMFIIADL